MPSTTSNRATGRVAYLLKKFPRLSETFILNELLGQQELGRDLVVLSRRPPDDEPRHPQLRLLKAPVEQLPRARELNPWRSLFMSSPGEASWDRLRALATDDVLSRHPRFGDLLAEALHVTERLAILRVDHVHVHFATDAAVLACLVQGLGGPSYSITAHAKDIYRSTVDAGVLDRVVGDSAFTVTVCDANVRHLQGLVGPVAFEQVRRLYNGVDLGSFEFTQANRRPNLILGVGRLVEKKGFDVLIDAAERLIRAGREVEVAIIGTGDQQEALAARIHERALDGHVELAGARDQEQVRAIMSRATVLCLPCRIGADGNRDALPTVLLEALASGLPCISTPVTGVPEILGVKAGVLVPCDDVDATARALGDLLDDPDARTTLAQRGRARAESLFDRGSIAGCLSQWFDECLSKEPRCASSM